MEDQAHSHYEEKRYRLAGFFDAHWEDYLRAPKKPVTEDQLRAVNALRTCRTEALGVRVYACPECGQVVEAFHSCKHRFCPTCSWRETLIWAEKAQAKMADVPHRHVVATLPHALNPLLKANYRQMSNMLLRASAETLKDWMGAKHGLLPGIMSVQHTFGEQKNWHHHAHSIASWGGLDPKTGKIVALPTEFVPFGFLSQKFRIKFEDLLVAAFDGQKLSHGFSGRTAFMRFLKKINRHAWTYHIEPPMEEAEQVIRYIGRYSKRFCLSERKITGMDRGYISFSYKDYKDKAENGRPREKECRLHYSEFFPRLLQHVPPRGFQAVRYYGLYANAYKTLREQAKTESTAQAGEDAAAACTSYRKAGHCPHCNVEMALVDIYFGPGLHKTPKEMHTEQTTPQPGPCNGHENWQRLPRAG